MGHDVGETPPEKKKSCYGCVYRRSVPGDAHIACGFNFKLAQVQLPKGDPHGIRKGWYQFPANYDPAWMRSECLAHATEADPKMTIDPLMSLIGLMR